MTERIPIPNAALAQHVIVLGKTRAGKSSKLRLLVEHLLDKESPVCIIDPKGDWWGLKSSADGKRPGYAVVIFGGEHADVPINRHSGPQVAELIATGNRPAIIDLGGWMVAERTEFFIAFASHLFKLTKGARYLVIDEVHNFCPKGKIMDPNAGKMLHWANRLASEGAGKGITLMAASQRPQKVHNDFLTSCETLIACKVIHKADRDAIKDWIDGCADPTIGKEVIAGLAQLKKPEAWVWSPEAEFGPKLVEFPMYSTYDSFAVQKAHVAKLKGWAEVDLDDVRAKLASAIEEAEQNDPAALKRQLADARRELGQAKRVQPAPVAPAKKGLETAEARGYDRGVTQFNKATRGELERLAGTIGKAASSVAGMIEALKLQIDAMPQREYRVPESFIPAKPHGPRPGSHPGNGRLPPGEGAVLSACIQYPEGLARSQLTVLTGYKRSSRDAYIARLKEKGYVTTSGDRVVATGAGMGALPDAQPLPTGQELREFWQRRLPDGERKILEILCSAYPEAVERISLDEQTGYQRSSRDAYLARMRAKQLIEEPSRGLVRASEVLFQ